MPAYGAPRHWGWHRLDSSCAARLVAEAGIGPGDLVLDIGAGDGALTAPLLVAGARVIAIELHPERARRLRERFASDDVVVVQTDATDLRLPRRPFSVVANPPFGAVTAVLRRLLGPGSRLVRADLVLPRHEVRRWTSASAPGRGRWAAMFEVGVGRSIPAAAFRPPPPTGAGTLVVRRRR
ncbi:MAG TPA: rRNA adenine N-6-methyltransferase family protein [Acidimicrobiales bacterium]|nr:rRNA adenine N-6-methyltransferase family protein [Acidimicrobiales bacterium]